MLDSWQGEEPLPPKGRVSRYADIDAHAPRSVHTAVHCDNGCFGEQTTMPRWPSKVDDVLDRDSLTATVLMPDSLTHNVKGLRVARADLEGVTTDAAWARG